MQPYKKIIIGMVGSVVVLVGLVLISGDKPEASSQARANMSSVELSETKFDFGTVSMKSGKVSHAFRIKNNSSDPLTVTKMYTSCMCTTAKLTTAQGTEGPFGMPGHGSIPSINQVIAAGEEATVDVTFDPAAHGPAGIGHIERVVTLETASGKLRLDFSADVTP